MSQFLDELGKRGPGFLISDFLTDRKSSIFGGLGGPGQPGNPPRRWGGEAPHLFGRFPGRPGPPRGPKIDDFRSVKKSYITNTGVEVKSRFLVDCGPNLAPQPIQIDRILLAMLVVPKSVRRLSGEFVASSLSDRVLPDFQTEGPRGPFKGLRVL